MLYSPWITLFLTWSCLESQEINLQGLQVVYFMFVFNRSVLRGSLGKATWATKSLDATTCAGHTAEMRHQGWVSRPRCAMTNEKVSSYKWSKDHASTARPHPMMFYIHTRDTWYLCAIAHACHLYFVYVCKCITCETWPNYTCQITWQSSKSIEIWTASRVSSLKPHIASSIWDLNFRTETDNIYP